MPVPHTVNDGDLSLMRVHGIPTWNKPFQPIDTTTREYIVTYRQDENAYRPFKQIRNFGANTEALKSFGLPDGTVGYLVDESEPYGVQPGMLEFTRTYANKPVTRYEGGSIVFPYQIAVTGGSDGPEVFEIPLSLSCEIKYEYSLTVLAPQLAPKAFVAGGVLYYISNFGSVVPNQKFLAEDSVVSIYKGFYQRRGVYVRIPAPVPQ